MHKSHKSSSIARAFQLKIVYGKFIEKLETHKSKSITKPHISMRYHTIDAHGNPYAVPGICTYIPIYINAKILYNIESGKGKAAISCSSRFSVVVELIDADSQVPYRRTYGHMHAGLSIVSPSICAESTNPAMWQLN